MGVQLPNKYAHEKHPFYFMPQMAPLHMKTHDDAVRLIEMTEQAEHWAQLSQQVWDQIQVQLRKDMRMDNENR